MRLFLLFLAAIYFIGCRQEPLTVFYIIPNDFQGEFVVRAGEKVGENIVRSNFTCFVNVPTNSVVFTRGQLPSRQWHRLRANYADGRSIPVARSDAKISGDIVALRRVRTETTREWFVVGTEKQATELHERLQGFKWPSNGPTQ